MIVLIMNHKSKDSYNLFICKRYESKIGFIKIEHLKRKTQRM